MGNPGAAFARGADREFVRQNFTMKPGDILARFAVVLSHPSHPANIGAAARAMKTMGIARLDLVAPRRFPHSEARALAAGAADVLERTRVHASLDSAIADCVLAVGFSSRPRDLSHRARALREAAPELVAAAIAGPVALVFGNETYGLTNEELGRCQRLVTIPANPDYPSLNVASAVQIATYELAIAAEAFGVAPEPPRALATSRDLEALYAHLEVAMTASGYLDPARPGRLMQRLRRFLARAGPEHEEVKVLRGMLAAFEKPKRRR